MILNKINHRWKLVLGTIGLLALLLGVVTPVSAATTTQNGNTSAAISFKNLNPENPNLPVGYPTGTAVTVKQKKATPSVTTETKPQATKLKSSVTVSSEGKGTTTLPQTSGASVPLIVVLIGLAGSSALSIPVIGKFVMTQ